MTDGRKWEDFLSGRTKKSCDYWLDTAVVIYAVKFPEKLSRRALAALRNLDNAIELSAVSVTRLRLRLLPASWRFRQ